MKLLKPFRGATFHSISTHYNPTHKATDWWYKYGTPLVAPENGKVIRILGNEYTPGNTHPLAKGYVIEIEGESGLQHEYWHIMPYLPVKVGDIVTRGQIVAYMGNSGNVLSNGKYVPVADRTKAPYYGTHLHQNVIRGEEYLDPYILIDMTEEPAYTIVDQLSAMGKTVKNMATSIAK